MSVDHAALVGCGVLIIGLLWLVNYLLDIIHRLEDQLALLRRVYRA